MVGCGSTEMRDGALRWRRWSHWTRQQRSVRRSEELCAARNFYPEYVLHTRPPPTATNLCASTQTTLTHPVGRSRPHFLQRSSWFLFTRYCEGSSWLWIRWDPGLLLSEPSPHHGVSAHCLSPGSMGGHVTDASSSKSLHPIGQCKSLWLGT